MNAPENSCCDFDRQGEQPNERSVLISYSGLAEKRLHTFPRYLQIVSIDDNCEPLGFRVLAKAGKMIDGNFSVRHR